MKDGLYIVLTLIAAAVAAYFMYVYATTPTRNQQMWHLIVSVVSILVAIVFAGLFLAGRVNKEEEIHITK